MSRLPGTFMPFLYPSSEVRRCLLQRYRVLRSVRISRRALSLEATTQPDNTLDISPAVKQRLDPRPDDYGRSIFVDKCNLILHAGGGGHGCVSFVREKWIPAGPANGGDGGNGGNIYIQAVAGDTSLHKLARKAIFKAGRGKNGQGKSRGGQRGEDVLIQVPIGTVLRETSRIDPLNIEDEHYSTDDASSSPRDKWVLAPMTKASDIRDEGIPILPKPRRTHLAASQPPAPIYLDLSKPMAEPMLLAAGAAGGLGNPHFVTKDLFRPKYATKGSSGMRLNVELELKLLADLGFVGLPNAGKSTLLRALSRSRARVGDWEFTTLQPNIGTVVLDDNHGRAKLQAFDPDGQRRTRFSIADIPGLVPDAHLDRGLGLDFLRHVERARVLAFVVDLGRGDAVDNLKLLWRELDEFEKLQNRKVNMQTETRIVNWQAFGNPTPDPAPNEQSLAQKVEADVISTTTGKALQPSNLPPSSSKPWFVVATKADLEGTRENYRKLQEYLGEVASGAKEHPAGPGNRWKGSLKAIAVSGIRGEGVDQIPAYAVSLLSK